MGAIYIIDF